MIAEFQRADRPRSMTVAEYLAWEATQPTKHEYLNGVAYEMAGGTLAHNDLALNLYSLLRSRVRDRGCRVNVADAKVRVSAAGPYFYPDLVVSCDDRDRQAIDVISYPQLIAEVLSPSTAALDRGDKFRYYRRLPTLTEYLLIDAEKVGVDRYTKTSGGKWELTTYPDDVADQDQACLVLSGLDLICPLALIYEGVNLAGDQNENAG